MKEEKTNSELAMKAMRRASRIAEEKAAERNLKLPIWKDGRIIFAEPKRTSQSSQGGS